MRSPDERPATAIYSAAQVRELDRRASAELGVPSFELMSRAGAEAFRVLRGRWPDARSIVVLCGAGNNAGDGLVLARHGEAPRASTSRVLAVAPPERLKGDAKRALDECVAAGITIERFAGIERPADAGRSIVVDALLGIGADRPLTGDFAAAVATANALGAPILALDIPSGLHADTGLPLGCAIRATATVTFVGLKQGLYLGRACDYTGDIELADLGLPKRLAHDLEPALTRLGVTGARCKLCRRGRGRRTRARAAGCCCSAAAPACRARFVSRPKPLCASARASSTSRRTATAPQRCATAARRRSCTQSRRPPSSRS